MGINLKKLAELFHAEPGVTYDATHCERVNGIMAWNRENTHTVCHNNVRALANNAKTCFFERGNCPQMIDPGNLWHSCSCPNEFLQSVQGEMGRNL